ncbi:hypothetical protein COB21_00445 [Candidatus Aerophobetes bacterium]|uniref:Peptidase S9 prolyl oligopeptidase catalytic domain-containing protein n=1 Tax=Aerophobetes bacterium TaxID=2030807 RepID=A0A2A4X8F0_UNCAE|nr:MAG: hypothetical protein COB21_00445 [Candidatus Aerophobetes bacterium]
MLEQIHIPGCKAACFYTGPPLSQGAMPALIYFSISAKDSLCLPPFNSPATLLNLSKIRIFSFTLPFHGDMGASHNQPGHVSPEKAIGAWADAFARNEDPLKPFISEINLAINTLHAQGSISTGKLFIAGLSRGAFIATLLAATNPLINHVLGFAPLIDLSGTQEFSALKESSALKEYDLRNLTEQIYSKNFRFYIGNADARVNTRKSFDFIYACTKKALSHKIRSAPFELIVYPSIGRDGHGTPEPIFSSGAKWIESFL